MLNLLIELLAEQGQQLAEQGQQLAEQGQQLAEQGQQFSEQYQQLAAQETIIVASARQMKLAGVPIAQISAITHLSQEEIESLWQNALCIITVFTACM